MNFTSKCVSKSATSSSQNQHRNSRNTKSKSLSFTSAIIAAGTLVATNAWAADADWPSAGADLGNSRYQDKEHRISAKTVGALQVKWKLATDGDVTAHPAVDGKYLYFPDSAGSLYKVEKKTGALVWKKLISSYTGINSDVARATPAVAGNLLILGNLSGRFIQAFGQPAPQAARVFAVHKDTGNLAWITQVDTNPLSFVTNSAVVYNDTAFVGVASNEELIAAFVPKANWQWQFRGSVLALDVKTGKIKWQTHTVPPGYYGGSVWGSTGAVDKENNQVFMSTGNNYAVPQSCLSVLSSCSPHNHFDSIIALDIDTGAINWASRGMPQRYMERGLRPLLSRLRDWSGLPRRLRQLPERQPGHRGPGLRLRARPHVVGWRARRRGRKERHVLGLPSEDRRACLDDPGRAWRNHRRVTMGFRN
jgi:outer membrane protein assembly factor BamB